MRGGRYRGGRAGCGDRCAPSVIARSNSRRGATSNPATSTARSGLTEPIASLPPPPQPPARTEQESPEARDAQRHEEPHIEHVRVPPTWNWASTSKPLIKRHTRERQRVTGSILLDLRRPPRASL